MKKTLKFFVALLVTMLITPMLAMGGARFLIDPWISTNPVCPGKYRNYDGLMSDFKLIIGDFYKPDIAILPIGSVFTLGPEEGAYACKMMNVKNVIPLHYKSFPALTRDSKGFKKYLKKYSPDTKLHVLEPGKAQRFDAN